MSSPALDPKAAALAQQLDKLDEDLASAEESMLSRLRAPLSRSDPTGDLAKRLREQEVRVKNKASKLLTVSFMSSVFTGAEAVPVSRSCIDSSSQSLRFRGNMWKSTD